MTKPTKRWQSHTTISKLEPPILPRRRWRDHQILHQQSIKKMVPNLCTLVYQTSCFEIEDTFLHKPIAKYKTAKEKVLSIRDTDVKQILQQAAKIMLGVTGPKYYQNGLLTLIESHISKRITPPRVQSPFYQTPTTMEIQCIRQVPTSHHPCCNVARQHTELSWVWMKKISNFVPKISMAPITESKI